MPSLGDWLLRLRVGKETLHVAGRIGATVGLLGLVPHSDDVLTLASVGDLATVHDVILRGLVNRADIHTKVSVRLDDLQAGKEEVGENATGVTQF